MNTGKRPQQLDSIDEATLLINAEEGIARVSVGELHLCSSATVDAVLWGIAHLAEEAREALNGPEPPQSIEVVRTEAGDIPL